MVQKLYIKTFGCQMNEYDSDKMADVLNAAHGMVATDDPEQADVILFNTCSVREKAQEKVFHDLGRVKHLKQARPDVIIGVVWRIGCDHAVRGVEHIGHLVRVVLVHLAAEGLDVEFLHHARLHLLIELRLFLRRQDVDARDVAVHVGREYDVRARRQRAVHDAAIVLIVNDPARCKPDYLAAEIYVRQWILLLTNGHALGISRQRAQLGVHYPRQQQARHHQ